MADPEPITAPSPTIAPPPPAPAEVARAAHGLGAVVAFGLALALLASLAAGFAVWRQLGFEREHGTRLAEIAQSARSQSDVLAALTRQLEAGADRDAALERRIAGNETVNRTLREEVLGLGERARLVEDAVASLAQARLEGAAALRLDEAELLLRLGAARLALFRDADGAAAAYRLADAQLAALDDASLAGVRQTLAAELAELESQAGLALEVAIAELDAIAAAIPTLPARSVVLEAFPASSEGEGAVAKLGRALATLVRIRRVDESPDAELGPLSSETARAALGLELALAQAALVAHDDQRYRGALARVRKAIDRSFDADAPATQDALARLARIEHAAASDAPPSRGRALEALANLRATRAIAIPGASLGAAAPTPDGVAPAMSPEAEPADPDAASGSAVEPVATQPADDTARGSPDAESRSEPPIDDGDAERP